VPPLLFAAHGDRARSWADVVRRARGVSLLAAIDLSAGGVEGLDEALSARPDAAVAVWSAGPLEATRMAERLVEHRGPSLLHPAPARPHLGSGVQVTHGWLSLSGIPALERLFATRETRLEVVRLRMRGLPEGPGTGLAPALYHAATLVHRFGRHVRVERAHLDDEQHATLWLDVDGVPWRVEVAARKGPEVHLVARTAQGDYQWNVDAVSESLTRPGAEPRAMPLVPWAERCLRQLATRVQGADLADVRVVRGFLDTVEAALERRLPPTPFALEPAPPASMPTGPELSGSFRIELSGSFRVPTAQELEALRPSALARIGLLGELPDAPALAPTPPPSGELPLAALAYLLELRPAVFLTVDPRDEERIRAQLPGVVERRERRVEVGAGDVWQDDRSRGRAAIELYAARDAETVRRLVELQERDPTEAAPAIGALLGYPACCVQAFAAQIDRADNSYNRYAIAARTAFGPGAWPSSLDDTALKLLPHFPCTYRCERSREQATQLLSALALEDAPLQSKILAYLRGPVLYFDHDHQIRLDGMIAEGGIVYHGVSIPWSGTPPFAQLAGAVAQGDRVVLTESALTVQAGDIRIVTLERTDPGLGLILPFGAP
jgi:hypothetical protein